MAPQYLLPHPCLELWPSRIPPPLFFLPARIKGYEASSLHPEDPKSHLLSNLSCCDRGRRHIPCSLQSVWQKIHVAVQPSIKDTCTRLRPSVLKKFNIHMQILYNIFAQLEDYNMNGAMHALDRPRQWPASELYGWVRIWTHVPPSPTPTLCALHLTGTSLELHHPIILVRITWESASHCKPYFGVNINHRGIVLSTRFLL